jgi:hypothetical protein
MTNALLASIALLQLILIAAVGGLSSTMKQRDTRQVAFVRKMLKHRSR